MNTLNLKLQESVNDITLPKIEEIVLEFIGVGSKVFQIGKQGPIPFEVISGSVTFYKANSVSDLTTEGKTAYSNSFPNTDSHHLAVVSSSCKIRLLPSLASGIWVTNVSQNGMSVSGSTILGVETFPYLPFNSSKHYPLFNMSPSYITKDIAIEDICNVAESFHIDCFNFDVPVVGTFTEAMRAMIQSSLRYFRFQFSKPFSGQFNLDLGLIPHTQCLYIRFLNFAGRNGSVNFTFNANYGGTNWFSSFPGSGWQLYIPQISLSTEVIDKIIIELARNTVIGAPLSAGEIRLNGTRSSASDAAWATIAARWGLTEGGVFV